MAKTTNVLVTGGAGFIGSNFIQLLLTQPDTHVLNLDKLTYAGNLESLATVEDNPRYQFLQADIADRERVSEALLEFQPDAIMHLAAESHVDRSIDGPAEFIQTNIVGTYQLLEATRAYWQSLPAERREAFFVAYRALSPQATLKTYVDHIDYIAKRIGVEHVGIGTDFNHGAGIEGFRNESQAPNITRELVARGYTEAQIAQIWGGNFL